MVVLATNEGLQLKTWKMITSYKGRLNGPIFRGELSKLVSGNISIFVWDFPINFGQTFDHPPWHDSTIYHGRVTYSNFRRKKTPCRKSDAMMLMDFIIVWFGDTNTVMILVGGFNPFEKYHSNWESFPNRGEIKKKVETTTLGCIYFLEWMFSPGPPPPHRRAW